MRRIRTVAVNALAASVIWTAAATAQPVTYQGQLKDNGKPINASCDLTFELFDAEVDGDAVAPPIPLSGVEVVDGLFNVVLDFGPGVFTTTALWLEITAGCGQAFGQPEVLTPRTEITPAPSAISAGAAASASDNFRVRDVDLNGAATLFFGPTDECSLGIDPVLTGLVERDPIGLRLIGPGPGGTGCRALFGPTDDCTIGIDPPGAPGSLSGLVLRDPSCVRVANPQGGPSKIRFGSTDDCSLGIDPQLPGLTERDPTGFRLLGQDNQGCRLIFGPTMDCTVEVDPNGPPGLLLRDPNGIRVLNPDPLLPTKINFGPTDDCSIGVDPTLPGLIERDPTGFRLLGQNNQGCRLIFGPTMDCTVEVDPQGPSGLTLRDPSGIRVLNPDPLGANRIIFGPTDECRLGTDPNQTGLVLSDPGGLRVRNIGSSGKDGVARVVFGSRDDCTIGIDPVNGPAGLTLRDPGGIRVLNPDPLGANRIIFGPTDECRLGTDPNQTGLVLSDPGGLRVRNLGSSGKDGVARVAFGGTDDCTIGIDPVNGPAGLTLRDPSGIRLLNPDPLGANRIIFGPTDECRLGTDPSQTGLVLSDPGGLRVRNLGSSGKDGVARVAFGGTDDCTIGIDPVNGPAGLTLRDPSGIRLLNPDPLGANRIIFGPTDECRLGTDPSQTGLVLSDPGGLRVRNIGSSGKDGVAQVAFGAGDECTISVDPSGLSGPPGLRLSDVNGVVLVNPLGAGTSLRFGAQGACSIVARPGEGMNLSDPDGFAFKDGFVGMGGVVDAQVGLQLPSTPGPEGTIIAGQFIQGSSRRWKENIQPIDDALDKVRQLNGVYFDWKPEFGNKPDLGFVAEDVARVLPEIVRLEDRGSDAVGMDYSRITALAVEAIKDQQDQIAALQADNDRLTRQLVAIERQIATLQSARSPVGGQTTQVGTGGTGHE